MAERTFKWRKVSRDLVTDERTLRLSQLARHLRLVLEVGGDADAEQLVSGQPAPGVGWLVDEYGDPYDVGRLAALVNTRPRAIEAALAELEQARIVVRSDSGAIGALDHEDRQLDPTTKRTRAARARRGGGDGADGERPGNAEGTPAERPGNNQRAEGRGQNSNPPAPSAGAQAGDAVSVPTGTGNVAGTDRERGGNGPEPLHPIRLTRERLCMRIQDVAARAGIPRGTLANIEAGHLQPTRSELGQLAVTLGDPDLRKLQVIDDNADPDVPAVVVGALHRARGELGLWGTPDEPPPTVDAATVRDVFAPAADDRAAGRDLLKTWLTVIRRATEEVRRERARGKGRSAEFFRLDAKGGLGGESRRRKYLETPDLDRREDETPRARGSPNAPRITPERKYENKTYETGGDP